MRPPPTITSEPLTTRGSAIGAGGHGSSARLRAARCQLTRSALPPARDRRCVARGQRRGEHEQGLAVAEHRELPAADLDGRVFVDADAEMTFVALQHLQEPGSRSRFRKCWSLTANGTKSKPCATTGGSLPSWIIVCVWIAVPADVPPTTPPRASSAWSSRSTRVPT
jgi:hypothetical protein